MNAPVAISIADVGNKGVECDATEPTENALRYDESVDFFTRFYRSRSTPQKVLLTVGAPLVVIAAIAGLAFFGLGTVSQAIESGNANDIAQAQAHIEELRMIVGATAIVGLVLTLGLFRAIQADVILASRQLIDCLRHISKDNTDVVVPHRSRTDEYGNLAEVTENIRLTCARNHRMHAEHARAVTSELEQQTLLKQQQEEARLDREHALRGVADQFERIVGEVVSGVASASSQLHSTSTMMATTADAATNRTANVAESMEEANSGATAAAAASDEFAMSIGEISRQAATSAELARNATLSASQADATITALSESANEVGQVVELIQTIAQRTNLLALNASIEAARGGEAGRGFAVVASEVKELAMQTSRATEQVAEQISAMQDTTGASVTALRSIASEVQQLETTAISIASAVDQQSVAGRDLAHSIDLAARGTEKVVNNIAEVRELSVSTGAAAGQVLSSSTVLEEQAATLKTQVNTFLDKVREG